MKKIGLRIAGICGFAIVRYVAVLRSGLFASSNASYEFAILQTTSRAAPQINANVSGTWTLTMTTPSDAGAQGAAAPLTLIIKQDENKVTGTLGSGRGAGAPLQGTVSGSAVTWTTSRRLADGIARDVTYKATVTGDTMTGSIAEPTVDPTQAYTDEFTARRAATQ